MQLHNGKLDQMHARVDAVLQTAAVYVDGMAGLSILQRHAQGRFATQKMLLEAKKVFSRKSKAKTLPSAFVAEIEALQ